MVTKNVKTYIDKLISIEKILKGLLNDTIFYGLSSVLGQLIGFLLLPLYTVYLLPEDYGVLTLVLYVPLFFLPIFSMELKMQFLEDIIYFMILEKVLCLNTGLFCCVYIFCCVNIRS